MQTKFISTPTNKAVLVLVWMENLIKVPADVLKQKSLLY